MQFDKRTLSNEIDRVLCKDRYHLTRRLNGLPPVDDAHFSEALFRFKEYLAASQQRVELRKLSVPDLTYPKELPITAAKDEICKAINANQVIVITGETGSGKTTQIPKMCLEAGRGIFGKIVCTQPRRIAAISLCSQVARELGTEVGDKVGFKIRFTDKSQDSTLVQFVTDGLLLAEIQSNRFLSEYDTIVIDEAHERTLNIDFLLGYLKQLLPKRPELKLIITSATIDIEKFSQAFPLYYAPRFRCNLFNEHPDSDPNAVSGFAPIISVSGRMYPVEVRYLPIDEIKEEQGDQTMIDLVKQAVEELLTETTNGDILVFMSGVQEIREALDCFTYLQQEGFVILPLFGRLTIAEQNRIFKPSAQRKIIFSTNIAETSITVPGIRYVVDTGRARISQYNTRTGTQGLPIKAISQSSADQRKGRCGRLSDGICIRLYSEEDYRNRDKYTTPEIQRSNLSEVILRLLSLRLGNIETFPFIDPPESSQIRAGFRTLRELGALDDKKRLTSIGKEMASLPVDPRTARMILQASFEKTIYPVLIIAAAISCQDPREKPEDKKTQAEQKHARFKSRESDLISLLNLWEEYHSTLEELKTQGKMRKFCKANFLSYNRIREWRDIHAQLTVIAEQKNWNCQRPDNFDYDAIHKSILAGYLPHIAKQKEKKLYEGTKNREYVLFPGSDQYQSRHRWIVAIELIETTKLYAHTVAKIDPAWLEPLAGNLCKKSWSAPHWDKKLERVVALEKVTLFGFCLVDDRKVFYGRINREEANRIFIREALVEGAFECELPFWKHNRNLIKEIETQEAKVRSRSLMVDDQTIEAFYAQRISDVACLDDLKKLIKLQGGDRFLFMTKQDLLRDELSDSANLYPSQMQVGNHTCRLSYLFEPGHANDGITIHLPWRLLASIREEPFEYLVPGLLKEKILWLLKSLPKEYRKRLVPVPEKAEAIWNEIVSRRYSTALPNNQDLRTDDFYRDLSESTFRITRVDIPSELWNKQALPEYLRMNYSVKIPHTKEIQTSRNLHRFLASQPDEDKPKAEWSKLIKPHQRWGVVNWDFGPLMQKTNLIGEGEIPIWGYSALCLSGQELMVTIVKSQEEAMEMCLQAVPRLVEIQLGERLAWLYEELRFPPEALFRFYSLWKSNRNLNTSALAKKFDSQKAQAQRTYHEALQQRTYQMVVKGVCGFNGEPILSQTAFERRVETAKSLLNGLGQQVTGWISDSLEMYHQLLILIQQKRFQFEPRFQEKLLRELTCFFPASCLEDIPFEQWRHCLRLLKCYKRRLERHLEDPREEQERFKKIEPYQAIAETLKPKVQTGVLQIWAVQRFCWMLEELKVSEFAQGLSTAFPISYKRLDAFLKEHLQN